MVFDTFHADEKSFSFCSIPYESIHLNYYIDVNYHSQDNSVHNATTNHSPASHRSTSENQEAKCSPLDWHRDLAPALLTETFTTETDCRYLEQDRHTQTDTHTHTDRHTDTHRQAHRQTHTHTQTGTQTDTHIQTHTHTQTDTHRQTHTHTDRHTDRHTQTQTDTQTHTHTDTHTWHQPYSPRHLPQRQTAGI